MQPSQSRRSATRLGEAEIWCSKCLGSSVAFARLSGSPALNFPVRIVHLGRRHLGLEQLEFLPELLVPLLEDPPRLPDLLLPAPQAGAVLDSLVEHHLLAGPVRVCDGGHKVLESGVSLIQIRPSLPLHLVVDISSVPI